MLAAINRHEILGPALLRPGRFDREVVIGRLDQNGREQILRVYTRQVTLAPDVELALIAVRTPGFVGAAGTSRQRNGTARRACGKGGSGDGRF